MYLGIQGAAAAAAAAAAALCVAMLLLLLQQLLLAADVRHRVPVGKICLGGSLNLIPVYCFSSLKHDLRFMYKPLGNAVAFMAFFLLQYIFGTYGHARSQDGRHAAAAMPPVYIYLLSLIHI